MDAQKIEWLVYPGSQLNIDLVQAPIVPLIEITGNPRGMASLAAAFLWLASFAEGHGFLSLTGLSFVTSRHPFSLSIVLTMEDNDAEGKIVLLDKQQQYQWQIDDEKLQQVAFTVHSIACGPEREYFDVNLHCDSATKLAFRLTSFEQ